MNFEYIPKRFCKEYISIKGSSSQIVQFMATVLGLKKSCDDWFDVKKIPEIKRICKKYGLYYKLDWVFEPCKNVDRVIDGGVRLPTTKMYGKPYTSKIKRGNIHVFFSKSKESLEFSYKNGWYPLIIRNRAIHKPYIDILRFGYFLGYPNCCINFFRRFNNRFLYNNLFETLKHTKGMLNRYCNPLLKDYTFSYIYHIPCSFNCKKTILYVEKLRKELMKLEPGFVERIDEMLSKPLLVFNEQDSYIFEGHAKDNRIDYKSFAFLGPKENDRFSSIFVKGNIIKVFNGYIKVYKKNVLLDVVTKKGCDGFILNFKNQK